MRADRLVALLMLLQARGRMSARELAGALEVSERTIYRDIDALSSTGVPIYAELGREGGYALLDSYRTSLTGLTDREVRALFMLSIPMPLDQLGVSRDVQGALRKLAAALPGARREDQERVRQRFYLDASPWHGSAAPVPHLQTVHATVWSDRRIHITYRLPVGITVEQAVDPYGLVAKDGAWYLVCAQRGTVRVHHVADLADVTATAERFTRPPRFDLADFWQTWCTEQEQKHALFAVTIRVAPHFLPFLSYYFGDAAREASVATSPPAPGGWLDLDLSFESFAIARDRLLACGCAVEVLEPQALRLSVADNAAQIVSLYRQSEEKRV